MKRLQMFQTIIWILYIGNHLSFAQEKDSQFQVKVGGFTQVTAVQSEGNKAFIFGFDRVRLIANGGINSRVDFKFQVDFVKQANDIDKDGDTPQSSDKNR